MKEYPTDEELKRIKEWDLKDPLGLVEFIKGIWKYGEDGYFTLRGKKIKTLWLSTAGWSGNEDIIEVLSTTFFWMAFWVSNKRGGHYKFKINLATYLGKKK